MNSHNFIRVFLRAEEAVQWYQLKAAEIALLFPGIIGIWNQRRRPDGFQASEVMVLARTGLSRSAFQRARSNLVEKGVIEWESGTRNQRSAVYRLGSWFVVNHEPDSEEGDEPTQTSEFDSGREAEPYRKDREKVREKANRSSRSGGDVDGFEDFWKLYPKKVGKIAAKKAFTKASRAASIEEIQKAVLAQSESSQWRRENGQFIPNPATWLNQGRWDDEFTEPEEKYENGF